MGYKFFEKLDLRRRLYLALLFAIVPNLILSFLYFQKTAEQMQDELDLGLVVEAESATKNIAEQLNAQYKLLHNLTNLRIFAVALEYQRFEGLQNFFDSVIRSDANYKGMLFVDEENKVVAHNSVDSQGKHFERPKTYWSNVLSRVSYSEPDNKYGVVINNSDSLFVFKAPVKDRRGDLKGYLVAVYKDSFIAESMETVLSRLTSRRNIDFTYEVNVEVDGVFHQVGSLNTLRLHENSTKNVLMDKNLTQCRKFKSEGLPSLEACFRADSETLMSDLRVKQASIISVLLISLGLFSLIVILLMRRNTNIVQLIIDKFEELSQGDYRQLEYTGDKLTDSYLRNTNKVIMKINDYKEESKNNAQYYAIAQTTQMLAHDVRKPFSLFKMGLDMLSRVDDPEKMKSVCSRLTKEVQRATQTVNGMLEDIMEIGRSSDLKLAAVEPESLVEASLYDVFQFKTNSCVEIDYSFSHSHRILIDSGKMLRVLSNIVGNGATANREKGTMWFRTSEITVNEQSMIEFVIGNSGPAIPKDEISKLFDAFYTRGKRNGTGLGLAIAKKTVTSHGGAISCRNTPIGVEFVFTLPMSNERSAPGAAVMPKNSSNFVFDVEISKQNQFSETVTLPKSKNTIEENLALCTARLGRKVKVALIDDEKIYGQAFTSMIDSSVFLSQNIDVTVFERSDELMNSFKCDSEPDAFILDVDLGDDEVDGFMLSKKLRSYGYKGGICVHSNRCLPEDFRQSVESKADAFLPKPMSKTHIAGFIVSTLNRLN